MQTVLQSSISKYEPFKNYEKDDIIKDIKNSTKKELVIVRTSDGFLSYEGKRNVCETKPVEIKIMIKKSVATNDKPKLSTDEQLLKFKEWYNENKRDPKPFETIDGFDLDKYYRKYCKNKNFVDKINEFVKNP